MNKFKKNCLVIFYIIVWFLLILDLAYITAAAMAIIDGAVSGNVEWFTIIVIFISPFLLGYLLRNHFKTLAKLIVKFVLFMKNIKLTLPATILLGCIILGGFFFATQVIKQRSIEKQQAASLQENMRQQEIKNFMEELKLKQDECEALSTGVIKKWNNVMGVTYDNGLWKECVVTFTDPKTGEIKTSPLRFMQTSK